MFEAAERVAAALGMSRNELYTNAVRNFVKSHSGEQITARLNEIYGDDDLASRFDPQLAALQLHSLSNEEWK